MTSLDDMDIEKYLKTSGLDFMPNDDEERNIILRPAKRKRGGGGSRKPRELRDNKHVADVLKNYDGMNADSSKK